jgi:hypothetical protein
MAGEGTEATDDLRGRESLTPVFENLNTYEATTHFKADGTWRFGERRLYVDWTETRTIEAARVA